MTDFRALCARMADELDHYRQILMDDRRETHALAAEARAALAQPEPTGLPPGYNDPEHTGADRRLLQVFYRACQSEGGIRAVVADAALAQPEPQGPADEKLLETVAEAVGYEHVPTDEICLALARAALARWLPHHALPVPGVEGADG
jgi:hypothetical protein